ncbi:MAG: VWA domain-containing protein, partial [Planctomycetota bacterium]
MTFANPALLWSLAALLPLGLVYLLKVRPRTRPTTAFFLWEQVLEDKKPNRLWDQLKNVISLLMMAAAFGAIGLAAAGPRFAEEEATDLLLVVDNSLSMSADAGGTTRLGLAKDEARRIARAMDGTRRVAVATAAARLRYVSYLSDNPREILAAIDTIGPTFEALDPSVLPSADGSDSSTDEGEDRGQTSPAEPDAAEG